MADNNSETQEMLQWQTSVEQQEQQNNSSPTDLIQQIQAVSGVDLSDVKIH